MSNELEQLRADLEVLERYNTTGHYVARAIQKVRDKIAQLEAEAADPWREAKQFAGAYREPSESSNLQKLIAHYDHLTAENERLTARVAEMENEPEPAKVVLKRAEEIKVGDVILAGGDTRAVTLITPERTQRCIECDWWVAWFGDREMVAVINGDEDSDDPILDPAKPGEDRTVFDSASCDRLIAWFGALEDTRREFLESADYRLAKAIYDSCGRTVPGSVLKGCGLTDVHAAKVDPDDPILDSARVLATAAEVLRYKWRPDAIEWLIESGSEDVKPYRLKGAEN